MKKLILLLILAFTCVLGLAACDEEKPAELSQELKDGQSFIKQLYEKASSETPSDYFMVGSAAKCSVTWSVNVKSGNPEDVKVVVNEDGTVTIDVNEKALTDVVYTLTATLSYNNETTTLSYERKLPRFQELTHAQYLAAEDDSAVVIKGIVTAVLSKPSLGDKTSELYLQDADGGYYAYDLTDDPVAKGVEVGMEVRVTGTKDLYFGTHQLKSGTVEIINSNKVSVTPYDITADYKAAADLKAESLVSKQSTIVTLKGVTIGAVGTNGYHYFSVEGATVTSDCYVRLSSSNCPLNAADTTAYSAKWAELEGHKANITGVVSLYSEAFYIQPVSLDSIEDLGAVQKTDAEAVAWAEGKLDISKLKFEHGKTVDLPSNADLALYGVSVSWASSNTSVIAIEGNAATVTAGAADTEVTLTATLTKNAESKQVEIKVTVAKYEEGSDEPALKEGTAYTISARNASDLLYFSGSISDGRFAGTAEASAAASVYVEIEGETYYLYFMNNGTKTYINMGDSSSGAEFVTDKANATVYEWNSNLKTLVVADDTNNRAFGMGATSTFTTFSCYDASGNYNWGQFTEVAA